MGTDGRRIEFEGEAYEVRPCGCWHTLKGHRVEACAAHRGQAPGLPRRLLLYAEVAVAFMLAACAWIFFRRRLKP